jgi:hypothetical protein
MAKESKHAPRLRELGFKHMPRKIVAKTRKKLGRKDEDYIGLQPTFTFIESVTYVTDEMGQSWYASGRHDLTSLGFRDNVSWFGNISDGKKPN